MWLHILVSIAAFTSLWLAARYIVYAVEGLAERLKISSFTLSFFLVGILTALPEFTIGINSIMRKDPQIFVGNLVGEVLVIFLLIIPLLAIFGRGIHIAPQLTTQNLLIALGVIIAPSLLTLNSQITVFDGLILIVLYLLLFFVMKKEPFPIEKIERQAFSFTRHHLLDIGKIVVAVIAVIIASRIIVDKTIYFSELFHISPYFISLVLLSVGASLPELSLVFHSYTSKGKKDIAFGGYIGSTSANTFVFGILTVINWKPIGITSNFLSTLIFILVGLTIFFIFSKSRNNISRLEGLGLLVVYILFLIFELLYTHISI